jgi:hypothetical protein
MYVCVWGMQKKIQPQRISLIILTYPNEFILFL